MELSLIHILVIVDEAHEGTTTALGDDVIKNLVKEGNGYDTKSVSYTHLDVYKRQPPQGPTGPDGTGCGSEKGIGN